VTLGARVTVAARTVCAAALVAIGAGALVRGVAASFDPYEPYPGHTANYGFGRPRAIRDALPAIAATQGDVAIVLGSSAAARAFVPSVFDEALGRGGKSWVSYNLAQVLLQPETALAMAKDVRRAFEAKHRRIGLVVFGISVPELATGSLHAAHKAMPDQTFAFATLDQVSWDDVPTLLLFGHVKPERVGRWVEDWWAKKPLGCDSGLKQPPEGREAYDQLVLYCDELARQFPRGVPPWNRKTRGALDFGLPETRPMLEKLVALEPASVYTPPPADPTRPWHDDIDDHAADTLVLAIRELAPVAEQIVVLRDLLNPAIVASLPSAQVARWHDVAARIAHDAEVRLLDMNDGSFAPSDFGDRTHLHPLAAERFSALLATRVRPVVQASHASR
jgi:hypothetical protein